MKCPNCGGEISVNELKCSYCGTPNPEAAAFHEKVQKKRNLNQFLREQIQKQMALPLFTRALNLSLAVMGGILFLLTLLYLIASLILENPFAKEAEETPAQAQMSILQFDYDDFLYHSMSCVQALEKGELPDTYHVEYTISKAQDLLVPDIPAYPDIYPENEEQLELWQEEALLFLKGIFYFTDTELEMLYPTDEYDWFTYEEKDTLTTAFYQHLREEGFFEAND